MRIVKRPPLFLGPPSGRKGSPDRHLKQTSLQAFVGCMFTSSIIAHFQDAIFINNRPAGGLTGSDGSDEIARVRHQVLGRNYREQNSLQIGVSLPICREITSTLTFVICCKGWRRRLRSIEGLAKNSYADLRTVFDRSCQSCEQSIVPHTSDPEQNIFVCTLLPRLTSQQR